LKKKLDECEDGSVAQRFCLAVLQKLSIKDSVTLQIYQENFHCWVLGLLERGAQGLRKDAKTPEIHAFCLDFSSALLANVFHNGAVLDRLEKSSQMLAETLQKLLALLKENLPTSVLIHLLICLSYLSKERFSHVLEEVHFVERISDFVEWFTLKHPDSQKQNVSERKTVLDLCAHMFHPKDASQDMSGTMEYNEIKQEERIKEFE